MKKSDLLKAILEVSDGAEIRIKVPIFDEGEIDGTDFLVLESVYESEHLYLILSCIEKEDQDMLDARERAEKWGWV